MNVSSVTRTGYVPLPTFQDMAAVLAARPSMAEMSSKAAVQASDNLDNAAAATAAASATAGGSVDLYL